MLVARQLEFSAETCYSGIELLKNKRVELNSELQEEATAIHKFEEGNGDAGRQHTIHSWRSISVEPLIEHIKDVFKIDPLPVKGYQKASGMVLLSVLLYQIIVYFNCKTHKQHPRAIKHMLGS